MEAIRPKGTSFLEEVNRLGKQTIQHCYQCQKCSVGCPVAYAMDYAPNQLIRMIQYGMEDEVLASSTIWLCASCETCTTRCPNEVDVAHLMDILRQMALKRRIPAKERNIPEFHKAFLSSVKKGGRVYELGMMGIYKLKTRTFFKDMQLGRDMFNRGKINILPHKIQGKKEIKDIFKNAKRGK